MLGRCYRPRPPPVLPQCGFTGPRVSRDLSWITRFLFTSRRAHHKVYEYLYGQPDNSIPAEFGLVNLRCRNSQTSAAGSVCSRGTVLPSPRGRGSSPSVEDRRGADCKRLARSERARAVGPPEGQVPDVVSNDGRAERTSGERLENMGPRHLPEGVSRGVEQGCRTSGPLPVGRRTGRRCSSNSWRRPCVHRASGFG